MAAGEDGGRRGSPPVGASHIGGAGGRRGGDSGNRTACPADTVIQAFRFCAVNARAVFAAFVVMPDHWHAVIGLQEGQSLSEMLKRTNCWISRQTNPVLKASGAAWQDGYHETRIRSARQFHYIVNYIEANPVERGLVFAKELWPWSSAHETLVGICLRPWPWQFERDAGGGQEGVPFPNV